MQTQSAGKSAFGRFAGAIYGFFRAPPVGETYSHSHQGRLLSAGLNCWMLVILARVVALFVIGDNARQQLALLPVVTLNILVTIALRGLMLAGCYKAAIYGCSSSFD
jgi:hypothetical protein